VTLAAMLGHSRIQMVVRYAHPTEEHQFEAVKKLQAFMGKKAVEPNKGDADRLLRL
jgi:hypothetical protein